MITKSPVVSIESLEEDSSYIRNIFFLKSGYIVATPTGELKTGCKSPFRNLLTINNF